MQTVRLQTHCENCGGDAFHTLMASSTVIIEFLEDAPFVCQKCTTTTYLEIEKRIGDA